MGDEIFVSIDVSKATLDVTGLPGKKYCMVSNDAEGHEALVAKLAAYGKSIGAIMLEATGGLQMTVSGELAKMQWPVSIVDPRQVRDFAKGVGRRGETDKVGSLD